MTTVESPTSRAAPGDGVAGAGRAESVPKSAPERGSQEAPGAAARSPRAEGLVRWMLSAAAVLVLVGSAAAAAWWLFANAPQQETVPAEATLPTVEVITPTLGNVEVVIEGFGEVIPARRASIAPEVIGRVIEVGESVEPGAFVEEGALLFRIDPADYEVAVAQAEADLAQAEADLALEKGRAVVAQQEWERFRDTLEGIDDVERSPALANREPQLRQAEARVQQAQAALALANLNLDRTEVRAPFAATVLQESVEVGLRAGPDMAIVDLAGTGTFWVTAAVPPSQGARLTSAAQVESLAARVSTDGGRGDRTSRKARLVRILPDVDRAGRMVRVLIAVDDPLARESDTAVMRLGDYASVSIEGGTLGDAVELPREAIRENDEVWVLTEAGTLRVLPVAVRWRSEDSVVVSAEFEEGDRVITSFLSDPVPGQALRARQTP